MVMQLFRSHGSSFGNRSSVLRNVVGFLGAAVVCIDVFAGPRALWTGNEHSYQVVVAPGIAWTATRDAAHQSGGHLATITSGAEDTFIFDLVAQTPSACGTSFCSWTGGFQPAGNPEPAAGWNWLTGEPFSAYNKWGDGEPNNQGDENVLHVATENGVRWWNDTAIDSGGRVASYVSEWDSAISDCTGQPDGSLCDDGNICTEDDVCANGGCIGVLSTVVSLNNMNGWAFFDDNTGLTGTGTMVAGPSTAPVRTGSARLSLDGGGTDRQFLSTRAYAGTRLDQITDLRYSTYRSSADAGNLLAISLQLDMDYDLTDLDTTLQGRLIFEPYLTIGMGNVPRNTWQTWSPLLGVWWATRAPFSAVCSQSTPCTWNQVLQNFPNAGIRANVGALIFKAGAPWPNFDGNVDALTIGTSGSDTSYDFEPTDPCSDGNACTTDACVGGSCTGTPITCDDHNACTDDPCNPATGCVYTADDTNSCSDGNACTAPDTCSGGACVCISPGSFTTEVAIYLDLGAGLANDTRFDYTSAFNGMPGPGQSTCSHRRDVVFNCGFYADTVAPGMGPRYVCAVGFNAGRGPSYPRDPKQHPNVITASGWYTFRHIFRDVGGALVIDMEILPLGSSTPAASWTLYASGPGNAVITSPEGPVVPVAPTDLVSGPLANTGGSRYGWIASNELPFLALDETKNSSAGFNQEFETDNSGWNLFGPPLNATRVATSTHGVTSGAGSFHAEAAHADLHDGGSAFTDWGSDRNARCAFPTGPCRAPCDDGDPCTTDACDPLTGCVHTPIVPTTYYRDLDNDGWGNPANTVQACSAPAGYVASAIDCDDTNSTVHPKAIEACDSIDNNCDGSVDEGFPDTDRDGKPDCQDNCLGIANADQRDADGDQIGDACDSETCGDGVDNDGNGYVDDGCGCTESPAQARATLACSGTSCGGRIRFYSDPGESTILIRNARVTLCRKRLFRDDCPSFDSGDGRFSFDGLPDGEYNIKAAVTYRSPLCTPTDDVQDCKTGSVTIENYAGGDRSGYPVRIANHTVSGETDVVFPRPVVLIRGVDPRPGAIGTNEYWAAGFGHLTEKDGLFGREMGKREFITFIARGILGYDYHDENARRLHENLQAIAPYLSNNIVVGGSRVAIDLVAHSMGGTVAREYLAEHQSDRANIAHLVMLGTPNAGITDGLYAAVTSKAISASPALQELGRLDRGEFNRNNIDYVAGSGAGFKKNVKYVYVGGVASSRHHWCGWLLAQDPPQPSDLWVLLQSLVPWNVAGADSESFRARTNGVDTTLIKDAFPYSLGDNEGAMCIPFNHCQLTKEPSAVDAIENVLLGANVPMESCSPYEAGSADAASFSIVGTSSVILRRTEIPESPGGHATFSVTVDAMPEVTFLSSWASGVVDVSLTDPTGRHIDPETSYPDVTYDSESDPQGSYSAFSVAGPPPGAWTIDLTFGPDYSALWDLVAVVGGTSTLDVDASVLNAALRVGDEPTVLARVEDAAGAVSGATCIAVVDAVGGGTVSVPLADDGVAPDGIAGDGVYTGLGPPESAAGLKDASIRCTGTHATLGSFERVAAAPYVVTRPSASLTTVFAEAALDTNGNGLFDVLEIGTDVQVSVPGEYTLSGKLVGPAGDMIATAEARFADAVGGVVRVNLRLDGKAIRNSGLDGPYALDSLELREAVTSQTAIDRRGDATQTAAYLATAFETSDGDEDGVPDGADNCSLVPNPTQDDDDEDGVGNACDDCPSTSNASQADADGDQIGDACDNCPTSSNSDQADVNANGIGDACDQDADSDGTPNAADCAPLGAGTSALPAGVPGPSFSADKTELQWSAPIGLPGELFRYVVVRGDLSELRADGDFVRVRCLGAVVAGTIKRDLELPTRGLGFYYLVAASNACGQGSFGAGASGQPRLVTACP